MHLFRTACLIVVLSAPAWALSWTWGSTVGGLPVEVSINSTFATDSWTITLDNLVEGPTGVLQNVSGFEAQFSGGLTGTLSGVFGQLTTVASDGTFAITAGSPDWFQPDPGLNLVTALGASGPDHSLLGKPCVATGDYSCSNSSITGNGAHNPMAINALQLVMSLPGANAQTQLTGLTLRFGTEPSVVVVDIPNDDVPEPGTFVLVGLSLWALSKFRG